MKKTFQNKEAHYYSHLLMRELTEEQREQIIENTSFNWNTKRHVKHNVQALEEMVNFLNNSNASEEIRQQANNYLKWTLAIKH